MSKLIRILFLTGIAVLLSISNAVAALGEVENAITFRGDQRRIALPPVSVHVVAAKDNSGVSPEIKRLLEPVLQDVAKEVPAPTEAALTLIVEKSDTKDTVRLVPKGHDISGIAYVLPADADKLRRALAGYARYAGLQSLQGKGDLSALQWKIHMYRPSSATNAKAAKIGNAFWEPIATMDINSRNETKQYEKDAMLMFSFTNTSRENLYVYIVNYTDDGQVLPVLPPQANAGLSNIAAHGKELAHPTLSLELAAPVERVRLIVSRVPLSIAQWQQDLFDADPAEFEQAASGLRPDDWASMEVVFTRK